MPGEDRDLPGRGFLPIVIMRITHREGTPAREGLRGCAAHKEGAARRGGDLVPLGLLGAGERAEVVRGREVPGSAAACRAEDMGLRPGKVVEMLANGGGPLLLKVDDARLALGRGMAMGILVRTSR